MDMDRVLLDGFKVILVQYREMFVQYLVVFRRFHFSLTGYRQITALDHQRCEAYLQSESLLSVEVELYRLKHADNKAK